MISLFTLFVVVPTVVSIGITIPAGIVGAIGETVDSSQYRRRNRRRKKKNNK
jgi:hypothetical protein